MKLTRNFTFEEFVKSSRPIPADYAIRHYDNLVVLANLMEGVRKELGDITIVITRDGGLRTFETNMLSGGAKNSQHLEGLAADFHCSLTPQEVFDKLRKSFLTWGQLICYPSRYFCHISVGTKKEALIGEKNDHGETIYRRVEG